MKPTARGASGTVDMDVASIMEEAQKYGVSFDIERVRDKIEMKKKEQILKEHEKSIWYDPANNYWKCYVPDETKPRGRKQVKRRKREDLDNYICDLYLNKEKKCRKSFENLYYEFMEYKKKQVTSGTISRMAGDWKKYYAGTEFAKKDFQSIKKIDIDKFFNDVLLEKGTMKSKAFNNMAGIMKQTFQYAVDAEYIENSPYRVKVNKKMIVPDRKKASQIEVYQSDEREMLIVEMERRASMNPKNTAPLAVMLDFELGIRKGEMLGLKRSDIKDGRIHIQRQQVRVFDTSNLDDVKTAKYEIVEYTKSRKSDRWLPLSERAINLLERVQQVNKENGWEEADYLFLRNGEVMTPECIDAQIKSGCKHIGVEVKRMHKIRKTYASELFEKGVGVSIVSGVLGHEDQTTTMKHYIYNTASERESERKVLDVLNAKKATIGNQKIVPFENSKKAENLNVYKVSHF